MNYIHVVVGVIWVLINITVINTDDTEEDVITIISEETVSQKPDIHTFTVLLHIVFTDGTKRQCTGTIIHQFVVITAAHCFAMDTSGHVVPELTLSFIVLGTQKMYESGYEQYLPIERVVLHPNFTGWSADLALVYTFTDMTSDRPGEVIPLLGERNSNPVDSNLTILSWGEVDNSAIVTIPTTDPNDACCESDTGYDAKKYIRLNNRMDTLDRRQRKPFPENRQFKENVKISRTNEREELQQIAKELLIKKEDVTQDLKQRTKPVRKYEFTTNQYNDFSEFKGLNYKNETVVKNSRKQRRNIFTFHEQRNDKNNRQNIEQTSAYKQLRSRDELQKKTKARSIYLENFKNSHLNKKNVGSKRPTRTEGSKSNKSRSRRPRQQVYHLKSLYKSWRRQLGVMDQKLNVQIFGFVNAQTCKKVIDREMPYLFKIRDGNDIACYTSDDHFITPSDSGAPALSQDRLMAVTVGGLRYEGDHIAVGMRMTCYCEWISDNLPSEGNKLECCIDCCGVGHGTTSTKSTETSVPVAIKKKKYRIL